MRDTKSIHVVGGALLRAGRCLVAERGPGMRLAGKWEFPGGKIEPGERAEHALARELREELGLAVRVGDRLGRGFATEGTREIVLDVFAAEAEDERATPRLREHARVQWCAAHELDALDWAAADVPVLPAVRARMQACEDAHRAPRRLVILGADWSVRLGKRAVHAAIPGAGWAIERLPPPTAEWDLEALLAAARALGARHHAPVLVAIDAVLGLPNAFVRGAGDAGFFDAVSRIHRGGGLDTIRPDPAQWQPGAPFFRVAPGAGGLGRFVAAAGGRSAVLRQIELRTGAKTVFAVSGIPGTVGAGSRALWGELALHREARVEGSAESGARPFAVWPFDGDLADRLASPGQVVLAETYPRLAAAIALARALPVLPRSVAKTQRGVRAHALTRLLGLEWTRAAKLRVAEGARAAALASEDDFDALVTAAALVRLVDEERALSCELVDPIAEGGILGTGGIAWSGAESSQGAGYVKGPAR